MSHFCFIIRHKLYTFNTGHTIMCIIFCRDYWEFHRLKPFLEILKTRWERWKHLEKQEFTHYASVNISKHTQYFRNRCDRFVFILKIELNFIKSLLLIFFKFIFIFWIYFSTGFRRFLYEFPKFLKTGFSAEIPINRDSLCSMHA